MYIQYPLWPIDGSIEWMFQASHDKQMDYELFLCCPNLYYYYYLHYWLTNAFFKMLMYSLQENSKIQN